MTHMNKKSVYALDFDGVVCDSAVETAMTGWKAARVFWDDMPVAMPTECATLFREVRPLIETGYESILAMRWLYLGKTAAEIERDYGRLSQQALRHVRGGVDSLKKCFGATRDQWIADDLADWVALNPLFPGMAGKLSLILEQSPCYIVTTKQERFVKQILNAHNLDLPDSRIFGLDRNMGKPAVLRHLQTAHPGHDIVFVEDRLPTLVNVLETPDLSRVQLILALWGYNTEADKEQASRLPILLRTLAEFLAG